MDTAVFLGTAENFVYGLCSAYFIYESATYFRHRREQRFYRTAAAIMAFWFLLVLKDPIYSCIDTQLHRHLYRTLLLVDMSAVFTCVFFVVELLSPIYITWSRIVQNSAFYLLMLVLYIVTANDIFFDINIVGMAVYCLIWYGSLLSDMGGAHRRADKTLPLHRAAKLLVGRQAVDVAGDSDVSVGAGGLDIFVLC